MSVCVVFFFSSMFGVKILVKVWTCFVNPIRRILYVFFFPVYVLEVPAIFSSSFAFKAIIPCFVCAPQIACQRINCSYAWENRHLFEVWARFRHSSFACRCGVKVRERTILSWGRVHVLCFFFFFPQQESAMVTNWSIRQIEFKSILSATVNILQAPVSLEEGIKFSIMFRSYHRLS